MSVAVQKEPLTAEEETLLNDQIVPILRSVLPEALVPRALAAIKEAIEQSKKRHGMGFGGVLPGSSQIGIQPISPKDFNLATTWTLRTNYTATGWNTLISSQTLSKYTHLVVCAYENLEPVPKTLAVKVTAGGVEQPITDLKEIKKSDKQFQAVEPYIAGPISVFTMETFVETTGYDNLRPWGFVIAPYAYLVSKTFIA
jgi:hypothetical protein